MDPDTEMRRSNAGVAKEPSVSSALERLVVASQGVITKRIDLALLEGQELLSRTLRSAMLASAGMMLALAAWLALVACFVEWVATNSTWSLRLGLFGLLNAGAAVAVAMVTRSVSQPIANVGAHSPEVVDGRLQLEGRPIRGNS